MTTKPAYDESNLKQADAAYCTGEQNGGRAGQTWHEMLLHQSPSSSQISFISERQTDTGTQPSTPLQARHGMFSEMDESATNYDSGNFSFSESGGKEKLIKAVSGDASVDLHQRFVQLNTELYQTKTELLTYKYKWNEIRNEIELSWSKKNEKLQDEKNEIKTELIDARKEIKRLASCTRKSLHLQDERDEYELIRIRTELEDVKLRLDCKERANECLKEKIVEQHVEKENLALKIKSLEHQLMGAGSEISRIKASERWFQGELHRCQIVNAKLKESNISLNEDLHNERRENKIFVDTSCPDAIELPICKDESLFNTSLDQHGDKSEENEELNHYEKMRHHETDLMEKNEILGHQNAELQSVLRQLQDTFQNQCQQLELMSKREMENAQNIIRFREHRELARSEIESLSAQLARECFTRRQIDVAVERLKAQIKVLSIQFGDRDCQRKHVEECESICKCCYDRLELGGSPTTENQVFRSEQNMCTENTKHLSDELQLLENFRKIQSKNLDLELKLGQCASAEKQDDIDGACRSVEMARRSEATIRTLSKNIKDLEQQFFPQPLGKSRDAHGRTLKGCPKHGANCRRKLSASLRTNDADDVEMRDLRIMLKAIECENRRQLQRFEINNRTLLKKVKEHARERKQAEQRAAEVSQEHEKCANLRCEMATTRERILLLEADKESFQQEAASLRSEKNRFINLMISNCLLTPDGDVWDSLKCAFRDLHSLKQEHKENGYLRFQLEQATEKNKQLEDSFAHYKLATDEQTAEKDELRAELAEKVRQLQESQRNLERLIEENSSLNQSISKTNEAEENLTKKLSDLKQLVKIQECRLESAHERLKLYEQSELILVAAKESFFNDLRALQDAILLEKQEKYDLEKEVLELRQNMVNTVGHNLRNFHPMDSSAEASGSQSIAIVSPDAQSLPMSCTSLDFDQLRVLVEESSQKTYSLQNLHECVSSLKLEMDNLNSVLQLNNYPQQQQQHHHHHYHPQLPHRFPLSLMDELNDATNGHYGSR